MASGHNYCWPSSSDGAVSDCTDQKLTGRWPLLIFTTLTVFFGSMRTFGRHVACPTARCRMGRRFHRPLVRILPVCFDMALQSWILGRVILSKFDFVIWLRKKANYHVKGCKFSSNKANVWLVYDIYFLKNREKGCKNWGKMPMPLDELILLIGGSSHQFAKLRQWAC